MDLLESGLDPGESYLGRPFENVMWPAANDHYCLQGFHSPNPGGQLSQSRSNPYMVYSYDRASCSITPLMTSTNTDQSKKSMTVSIFRQVARDLESNVFLSLLLIYSAFLAATNELITKVPDPSPGNGPLAPPVKRTTTARNTCSAASLHMLARSPSLPYIRP